MLLLKTIKRLWYETYFEIMLPGHLFTCPFECHSCVLSKVTEPDSVGNGSGLRRQSQRPAENLPRSGLGLSEDTRTSGREVLLSSQISLLQRGLFSNMLIMVVAAIVDGSVCVEFFKARSFGCTFLKGSVQVLLISLGEGAGVWDWWQDLIRTWIIA